MSAVQQNSYGICLYISFRTNRSDVVLSNRIKNAYPEEITIVLENQFRNLCVDDNDFSVTLAFGGIDETIKVPFQALTGFTDRKANFNIRFNQKIPIRSIKNASEKEKKCKVISIDAFRKKK